VVPLQECDEEQQKTNALRWLQIKIFPMSINPSIMSTGIAR
jgi:hypothetical protein